VLGWVPGLITMLVAGVLFYITSLTMHKFIMKHPQIKDICDFGYYAFGKSRIAYEFTAIMLLLNNSASPPSLPTYPHTTLNPATQS